MKKKPGKILIFFIVGIISLILGYKTQRILVPTPPLEEIVEMEALPAPPVHKPNTPTSGQSIYESHCAACHDTGVANAPKLGDNSAWSPRIAQGYSVLLQHVQQGYNLMPPKGACLECSDTDLKAATEYIVKKSNS